MNHTFSYDERVTMAFSRCGWMKSAIEVAVQNIEAILATRDLDHATSKALQEQISLLRAAPRRADEVAIENILQDRTRAASRAVATEAA